MTDRPSERLYNLLPAIFRMRDGDTGEQLRAFMAVLEETLATVEGDIDRLYDNWFVQTCDEATVPYIADLVDVRGLTLQQSGFVRQRALVANAIAHRRRKGAAETLELVARDVTGWHAHAVEMRRLLAATPSVRGGGAGRGATVDLRRAEALEWLGSPFDGLARTPDLRIDDSEVEAHRRPARPNLGGVALFLWRLQSYPIQGGTPGRVGPGRYTFHPLGLDAPLFNIPRTMRGRDRGGQEAVAHRLLRWVLADELDSRRRAAAEGRVPSGPYFDEPPVLRLYVEGREEPVPPEEIVVGDLTDWRPPASEIVYPDPVDGSQRALPVTVAVDPLLGRLTCAPGVVPRAVDYAYGFSADVGGGPYDRHEAVDSARGGREVTWQAGVGKSLVSAAGEPVFATLGEAVRAWNTLPPGETGLIAVADSATYEESLEDPILLSGGSTLVIIAGGWPIADWEGARVRLLGQVVPELARPVLRGDLVARGVSRLGDARAGQLCVDGLLIDGALRVLPGSLGRLRLSDATLVPGRGGLVVEDANHDLRVELERCIVGSVRLASTVPELAVADSVVDGDGAAAIVAVGTAAEVQRATFLGPCRLGALEAADSIFTDQVAVQQRQRGGLEACYLPPDSATPRRARCQPDRALAGCGSDVDRERVLTRLVPSFASTVYGDPFYAQLLANRAPEIAHGARNESEMGAFNHLLQPLRHRHLRAAVDELLGLDLEARMYYVT